MKQRIDWVLTGYAGVQVFFEDEGEARKAYEQEIAFAPTATLHKRTLIAEKVLGN